MATEATVRRWGNSLGIVLSRDVITEKHLKEDDVVLVEVVKRADFGDIFGSLRRKASGQRFKDLARAGWRP